jgi:hypothetical protein
MSKNILVVLKVPIHVFVKNKNGTKIMNLREKLVKNIS